MTRSYFDWIDRHTRKDRGRPEDVREHSSAAPPEPLEVQEHHASTTIIQKIRAALLDRLRGD